MNLLRRFAVAAGLLAVVAAPARALQPPTTGYYSLTYDTTKGTSTLQTAGQIFVSQSSKTLNTAVVLLDGTSGFITINGQVGQTWWSLTASSGIKTNNGTIDAEGGGGIYALYGVKAATITATGTTGFTGNGGGLTGISALTGFAAQAQALNMGTHLINAVTDPVSAQDAATKNYVDNTVPITIPDKVTRLATAAALPTNAYANGAAGVGATLTGTGLGALTVDGVATAVGDRITVKNEADTTHNGLYSVTTTAGGAFYVLTRATDFNQPSEMIGGTLVVVDSGTVNNDALFVLIATITTVGTDLIQFAQVNGGNQITAGYGILKAGNTVSVDTTAVLAANTTGFQMLGPNFSISGGTFVIAGGFGWTAGTWTFSTDGGSDTFKGLMAVATGYLWGSGGVIPMTGKTSFETVTASMTQIRVGGLTPLNNTCTDGALAIRTGTNANTGFGFGPGQNVLYACVGGSVIESANGNGYAFFGGASGTGGLPTVGGTVFSTVAVSYSWGNDARSGMASFHNKQGEVIFASTGTILAEYDCGAAPSTSPATCQWTFESGWAPFGNLSVITQTSITVQGSRFSVGNTTFSIQDSSVGFGVTPVAGSTSAVQITRTFSVTGNAQIGTLQLNNIASGTQCLQADGSGNITGTGGSCGAAAGTVVYSATGTFSAAQTFTSSATAGPTAITSSNTLANLTPDGIAGGSFVNGWTAVAHFQLTTVDHAEFYGLINNKTYMVVCNIAQNTSDATYQVLFNDDSGLNYSYVETQKSQGAAANTVESGSATSLPICGSSDLNRSGSHASMSFTFDLNDVQSAAVRNINCDYVGRAAFPSHQYGDGEGANFASNTVTNVRIKASAGTMTGWCHLMVLNYAKP